MIEYSDLKTTGIRSKSPSIFLAGPTPRSKDVKSWRLECIELFKDSDYNLFVPEPFNGFWPDYTDQIEWEHEKMELADFILFWIPRNLETLPGFTTNVEFGYWMAKNPNKVIYGRPDNAVNCRYLDALYGNITGNQPFIDLSQMIKSLT